MPKRFAAPVLALAALLAPAASHALDVTGALVGDTLWVSGGTYRMTGDVIVPAGVTLTIEPGTTITSLTTDNQVGGSDTTRAELIVDGTVKVGVDSLGVADPSKPVVFSGYGSGSYWAGIVLHAGSTGHVFKNVDIGFATNCVSTASAFGTTLEDVSIHNCAGRGIWVSSTSASLTFKGTVPASPGPAKAKITAVTGNAIENTGALTVTNADIFSNSTYGVYSSGNSQIVGSVIRSNGNWGVYWSNALAGGNQTLSRNVIYNNYYGGLSVNLSLAGITDLVEHNTFDNNDSYYSTSYEVQMAVSAGTLTVRDNIAGNDDYYGFYRSGSGGTVDVHHNNVWNNAYGDYYNVAPGVGAVSCNPLFASPGLNFRITANSPSRGVDSQVVPQDIGALGYISDPTVGLQGILRSTMTLTAAGSPYAMPGDLVVPLGINLNIDPGVTIVPAASDNMRCNQDTARVELIVRGTLNAPGTAASKIAFTPSPASAGTWYGILFDTTSAGNVTSNLDVGYGVNCIYTNASNLVLSNPDIHHCSQDGVTVGMTTSSLTLTGTQATSQVRDNLRFGINNTGALTLVSTTLKNNANNAVYSTGNSQLNGNDIFNNGSSGSGFGVFFNGALPNGNQSMSRNLVHGNYGGGLTVNLATAGVTDLIEHNTFDNNDVSYSTSYEVYVNQGGGTVTVRDNILTNDDYYGLYLSGYGGTFDVHHNDSYGNAYGNYYGTTGGVGALHCNPLYVSATNYRLTEYSPARMADSQTPVKDMGALGYIADPTPTLQGIMRSSRTLTAAGSPWQMPGDFTIPVGVTLTLEAGSTLVPASGDGCGCNRNDAKAELIVQGSLVVNGTQASRALIRPATLGSGQWEGVRFESTSTGNTINFLDVGYGSTCVNVEAPNVTLNNTKVHDCSVMGVYVAVAPASLTMTGSTGLHGGNFLLESAVYNSGSSGYQGLRADGELALSNTDVYANSGGGVYFTAKATLTSNRIRSTGTGYGIIGTLSTNVTDVIQRNIVYGNYYGGLSLTTSGTPGTVVIDHNTIDQNTGSYTTYGINLALGAGTANTVTLKNNIVSRNGTYGIYTSGYSPVPLPDYNDVWNQTTNDYGSYYTLTEGVHSISTNPLFNYPVGGDYRLQPPSPARNVDNQVPAGDLGALPFYNIPVDHIDIVPGNPNVQAAAPQIFNAQAVEGWSSFPINGLAYTWAAVAGGGAINAAGTFTAGCTLGAYPSTVRASSGGVNGFTNVTVVPGVPASVTVTPASATVNINQSQTFAAQAKDSCGNSTTGSVVWSITDPTAGVIDANGVFTANVNAGTYSNVVRAIVSGISGYSTVTVSPDALAYLVISPNPGNVNTGTSGQFTAVGKDQWNNVVPATPTWSMAPGCTIGSVNASTGVFTAGGSTGTCNSPNGIRATQGGIVGNATVNSTSAPLAAIVVSPSPGALAVNGTLQYTASGRDASNNVVAITPTWTVSGGGTISTSGLFTAGCTPGTFTVTATQGAVSGVAGANVSAGLVATVTVSPAPASVAVGASQAFTAVGKDSCSNTVAITPTWAVIAGGGAITSGGLFTAGGAVGAYSNTVRANAGSVAGYATVNVTAGPLAAIVVTPNPATLAINGTQAFTATGTDSAGNPVTFSPTWTVIAGGGTITSGGLFTAGGVAGTFTNTVRAGNGTVTGTATVVVNAGALASITVAPSPATLAIGAAQQFTATGKDSGGNVVPITPTWTLVAGGGSLNSTGLFTAGTTPGTYTNTVKAASGGVNGTATVVVNPGPLATITVTPSPVTLAAAGTQQFTAVGKDSGGNVVSISPTWSVVAGGGTIGPTGLFTAGSTTGTYADTVKATSGGVSGTATVVVSAGALASITLTPPSATLLINATQAFTAVGNDSGGNVVSITPTWTVVAGGGSISSGGLFTAGSTAGTFTNTVKAASGSVNATATVTVQAGALSSITVSPDPATLAVGQTQQFTAVGKDSGGNTVSFSPTWAVVASGGTINSSGLFTAGSTPGSYANTVTATGGGITGTASVTVSAGALATVTVTPGSVTLAEGGTQAFSAVGKDAAGNVVAFTPTWTVVAGGGSVDSAGVFTAGNVAGTFTNTVKAAGGSVVGTATVVVQPGPLASLTVSPNPVSVGINGTQQLTAVGKDAAGNVVPATATWAVVSGGGTVDAGTGLFTAGATAGTFTNTVVASAGSVTGSATVTVNPGPLASLTLTPNPANVGAGGTAQFTASGADSGGNPVAVTPTWTVVAGGGTISTGGLFTAGTVAGTFNNTVKAVSGALNATATVVVTPGQVASITVTPNPGNLAINGTLQLTATAKDSSNNVVPVTATWTVVAGGGTVSTGGLFTAGTVAGTFTNTVQASSGSVSGTATVVVAPGPLATLTLTPNPASLGAGGSQQFTATGKDAGGNAVAVTPTWSVVAGGGTVTSGGLFTAGGTVGTFTNTVKATSGSVSATATVVVNTGSLASITVLPDPASVGINGAQQFTASGKDGSGNTVAVTCTWNVVNGGGTINAASGLFTAGATAGTFPNTVVAQSGGVTGYATVTVNPGTLASLQITPNPAGITVGGTQAFTATGIDSGGNSIPVTVTWTVVAGGGTINSSTGVFTAGTVSGSYAGTVRATSGSVSATATINLQPGAVDTLTVSPKTITVGPGAAQQFTAVAVDAYGNTVPSTPTWSLAQPLAGTIASNGAFTAGSKVGTYANVVVASFSGKTDTASVTVNPGPLTTITLTPANATMQAGQTRTFSAQGRDAFSNPVAVTPTWAATSAAGTITQGGAFKASFTAGTYANAISATSGSVVGRASVTITPATVASVVVSPANPTVCMTRTVAFSAKAFDPSGVEIAGQAVAWTAHGGGTLNAAGYYTAGTAPGNFDGSVTAVIAGMAGKTSVVIPVDFDQDAMDDAWELANGLDPTRASDATEDPDSDKLVNRDEFKFHGNPHDADTDDDGVIDGDEMQPGNDVDGDGLNSVNDLDSDGDGIPDGVEQGVTTPNKDTDLSKGNFHPDLQPETTTDPQNRDTDADGIPDGVEDFDHNGRVDQSESDPNATDTTCVLSADCGEGSTCVSGVCRASDAPAPGPLGCAAAGTPASAASTLGWAGLGLALAALGRRRNPRVVASQR